MDWTAVGSAAAVVGVVIPPALWWIDRHRRPAPPPGRDGPPLRGTSVAPPTGLLPTALRGREEPLRQLLGQLHRPPGTTVVLAGLGGAGKSTVATLLADKVRSGRAGRRHDRVWWISAADRDGLMAGLLTVAQELDAPEADQHAIESGLPDAPDRFWKLLDRTRRGWLLVFDNADDPALLAAPAAQSVDGAPPPGPVPRVADGTGWIRPSKRGLTVVTSRDADPETWGRHAEVRPVRPLDVADAARLLQDLAPRAGGPQEAEELAERLGGLPLVLVPAGKYLDSPVARWQTFADYRRALDTEALSPLFDGGPTDQRAMVLRTWEISLDALARSGVPQARPLLRLLACYAPGVPVPLHLLPAPALADLLGPVGSRGTGLPAQTADRLREEGLRGLHRLGLIELSRSESTTSIVVHPVVADANRVLLAASDGPAERAVSRTAARLVVAALAGVPFDLPVNWAVFRLIGPHLLALFTTVADRLPEEELTDLVDTAHLTACGLDGSGAVRSGERLCLAVLEHVGRLGAEHLSMLAIRHEHAWQVAIQGRWAVGAEMFREVCEARARVLGEDHPATLGTRSEVAWVTALQGNWGDAETAYQEVLTDRQRVLGEDDPDTLITDHELAWTIGELGRHDEAEAAHRRILVLRQRRLERDHQRTLMTRHELAWLAVHQGRPDEALEAYLQLVDVAAGKLGAAHPMIQTLRHEIAWVYARMNRRRKAITAYEQVLARRRSLLGADHPDTRATEHALRELRAGRVVDAHHTV